MNVIAPSGERRDDRLRDFGEMAEGGNYWCVSDPEARFVDHYLNGDLGIVFRRKEGRPRREPKQDGFILKMIPDGGVGAIHRHLDASGARSDLNQFPMLSFKVEVMEEVERVVPSFVRSYVFDRGSFRLGKPIFRFVLFDSPQKIGGIGGNWKIRTAISYHAIALNEGSEQQIEACSQRVDDGTDLGVQDRVGWAEAVKNHQDVAALIRVRLHSDVIWAAPLVGYEALFEAWDLGYGPVDCGLSIKKVIEHG
jgi:hypothetical protein